MSTTIIIRRPDTTPSGQGGTLLPLFVDPGPDPSPLDEVVAEVSPPKWRCGRGSTVRVYAGPLLELLRHRYALMTDAQQRAYHRAQHRGSVTLEAADTLAAVAGEHPAALWGEGWWAAQELQDTLDAGAWPAAARSTTTNTTDERN